MTVAHCPTCHKTFERESSKALPFCCDRCRQIDLGRWLSEEQRLPVKGLEEENEESRPDDSDE